MPLRGSLFVQLQKLKKRRQRIQQEKFIKGVKNEATELKKLRKKRISEQGRSLLQQQIQKEKNLITKAKLPRKRGKVSIFIKAGVKELLAETKKRRKKV